MSLTKEQWNKIEKEFDKKFSIIEIVNKDEAEGTFILESDREKVKSFLKQTLTQALEEQAEEIIDIIKNGGTHETVLEITHNGEKFVNVRQLIKSLISSILFLL